jgi:hypothetical protein
MTTANAHRHYSKKDDAELRQIKALPTRKERKKAFTEWAEKHARTVHGVMQRAGKLRKYKSRNGTNEIPFPESTQAMPTVLHGTIEVPIKSVKIEGGNLLITF